MGMTLVQELTFEAAHYLPKVPAGHKCRRMHGHSFRCEIHISGPVDPNTGWVQDFDTLTTTFAPLLAKLDHHLLNEIDGLANPTSENLACWIWEHLKPTLKALTAVVVHETCTSRCIYTGP